MGLILPLIQTRQPQQAARVNWANQINHGLTYSVDHSGIELVSGKRVTLPLVAFKGALAANLQTNDIDVSASAALALGTEWSIAYSFIPTSLSGTFDLFFERNAKADTNHFELYKDSSTGKLALYIVSSAGVLVGGPVLAAGTPVDAIITASAGTLKLYLAGVFVTSVAWAGTIAGATSWARFNATESGTTNGRQQALFFRAWNRPLSATEVLEHYINPWQLGQASQRPLLVDAPVAGTPATGTFATTMGDATLAASGAVVDAGTFATTMASATMAASGAVTNVGTFSSLLAGATMSAAGGIVSTGTFASTLAGASMTASGSSGAFVPYTKPIITRRHLRSRSRSNFGA